MYAAWSVAKLFCSLPGGADYEVELGARTLIGRHPGCDVQLLDEMVSKEHCEIVLRDGNRFIRDLGTTNGTRVNGVRLAGERRLDHLDEIGAGRMRLLFLDPEAALRRSSPGGPYRHPGRRLDHQAPPPAVRDHGDLPSLRRFYALVRMLSAEQNRAQLATDAAHGLLSLCDAEWAVLCERDSAGAFHELSRVGREQPPAATRPFPGLFDVVSSSRAPTFQMGQDRALQLVMPLVHADRVCGVFWVGLPTSIEISPVVELLGTYGAFVGMALGAHGR